MKNTKLPSEKVLAAVRKAATDGTYRFGKHAMERLQQRVVTVPEVVFVLKHGKSEKAKDQYSEEHSGWKYSIRGKTIDGRDLRIPVAFKNGVLIVTVIDITRDDLH